MQQIVFKRGIFRCIRGSQNRKCAMFRRKDTANKKDCKRKNSEKNRLKFEF